jgi:hypothetical protein
VIAAFSGARTIVALAVFMIITACGGGGGSSE